MVEMLVCSGDWIRSNRIAELQTLQVSFFYKLYFFLKKYSCLIRIVIFAASCKGRGKFGDSFSNGAAEN
jgi:hypothetical protein